MNPGKRKTNDRIPAHVPISVRTCILVSEVRIDIPSDICGLAELRIQTLVFKSRWIEVV